MPISKAHVEIPIGPNELEQAVKEYVQKHYRGLILFLPSEEINVEMLVGSSRVPPGVVVQPKCEGALVTIDAADQT